MKKITYSKSLDKQTTLSEYDFQSILDCLVTYIKHCDCAVSWVPQTHKNEVRRLLRMFGRVEGKDGFEYYRFASEVGYPPINPKG